MTSTICKYCRHDRTSHNRERGCTELFHDGAACVCDSGDGIREHAKGKYSENYLAYCADAGRTPDAQMAHDKAHYPGGSMAGFLVWMSGKRIQAAKV